MSPTLINRTISPTLHALRQASFSTATPMLKPMVAEGAASMTGASKWRWSNLSPKTRKYIIAGATVGACVDSYVFYYYYWNTVFGKK